MKQIFGGKHPILSLSFGFSAAMACWPVPLQAQPPAQFLEPPPAPAPSSPSATTAQARKVGAYVPQVGDVVFHTSTSSQSQAVQAATGSPWSHMGIVLLKNGVPQVFEAVQPVQYTPLPTWLARGQGGHYVVKRPKQPLSAAQQTRLARDAAAYEHKSYDLTFEWSNTRIYCSELVWKLYESAVGVQLAPLAKLGSFHLTHPAVQAKLKERYGTQVPLNEPVISPQAIFDSALLHTVAQR